MARRTREIWLNLVGQFERSGKKMEDFASERGLRVGTLKNWVYRLKREKSEEASAILPVRVIGSASPSAARRPEDGGAAVEVMLVQFPSSATSDFIVDVVNRLRRC
jgi:hypothetical protein